MAAPKNPGEDKAWEILATLKPEDVCKAASVSFDPSVFAYTVPSFGMDFSVNVRDKIIASAASGGDVFMQRHAYFFRLSVLWYLVHAKDIACTGRLVKLESVKGGNIFTTGSHVLPLDKVAQKYGKSKKSFLEKGKSLGGKPAKFGDVAIQLAPLPKIPAVLLLWLEDEEFPARADLLFDSTCELQLPTDMLWSIAMMNVLAML